MSEIASMAINQSLLIVIIKMSETASMAINQSLYFMVSTVETNCSDFFDSNCRSSKNDTVEHYDIIHDHAVQALFCILYTTIFVLGVFGNVLVCYVVGRNRAMQTVTNFFITNLALSDILLCTLAVPFTPLYTFLGQWIFGRVLCRLVSCAQGISVYISTLTLTSIAIDRFFVIIYPFQQRMQLITCIIIIFSIWMFSLIVTLPYGIYIRHRFLDGRYYCEEFWPSEDFRQLYGALTTSMQFVLPFIIIAFCYIKVSLKLNDRARAKPGSKNSRKEELDRERKRRTNRMLIAMVTIFGVSWLPLNLVNLLNDLYIPIGSWKYYNLCFFMVHAIAMSSTCYNPFLYAWLNENFRKEFKQVLPCFVPSGSRSSASGAMGRTGGWRSERTCNGNETMQETLLPTSVIHRAGSVRIQMATDAPTPGKDTDEHVLPVQNKVSESDWRCKVDHVDVETVLVPAATYSTGDDSVHLQLTIAGDNSSMSSPKAANSLKTEIKDTAQLAGILRETL
ncbi:Prolactin-releasing peptide receptor [Zootermopsis nevadensis]|uniref:Prolactin-releasing peptide receptor n=2 Tax=Zootermopsis nevadensis TaxID=136037 RepID=A0A067RDC3_ZOONE|nr:Prolactin-releasing peptide receptor [Zootermopsis nevadensis]